jgi:hypothetical protein
MDGCEVDDQCNPTFWDPRDFPYELSPKKTWRHRKRYREGALLHATTQTDDPIPAEILERGVIVLQCETAEDLDDVKDETSIESDVEVRHAPIVEEEEEDVGGTDPIVLSDIMGDSATVVADQFQGEAGEAGEAKTPLEDLVKGALGSLGAPFSAAPPEGIHSVEDRAPDSEGAGADLDDTHDGDTSADEAQAGGDAPLPGPPVDEEPGDEEASQEELETRTMHESALQVNPVLSSP